MIEKYYLNNYQNIQQRNKLHIIRGMVTGKKNIWSNKSKPYNVTEHCITLVPNAISL